VLVQYDQGAEEQRFCGDTWCAGGCGLPALVIPGEPEYKTHSAMVAFGPVMQPWRVNWIGEKVAVPEEHRADFMKRYWI